MVVLLPSRTALQLLLQLLVGAPPLQLPLSWVLVTVVAALGCWSGWAPCGSAAVQQTLSVGSSRSTEGRSSVLERVGGVAAGQVTRECGVCCSSSPTIALLGESAPALKVPAAGGDPKAPGGVSKAPRAGGDPKASEAEGGPMAKGPGGDSKAPGAEGAVGRAWEEEVGTEDRAECCCATVDAAAAAAVAAVLVVPLLWVLGQSVWRMPEW
mmetsp:Transcript_7871/g.21005  ORF Transcript_7871/g.21005 Transcript_7871/m.21005 type:complete len:211 (-) Transcript_7871:237-869(-)